MIDGYLVGLVWSFVLGASILLWPVPSQDKSALLLVWLAKIVTTLGIMLIFESHYEGQVDGVVYYHESITSSFAWDEFIFGDGSSNLVNFSRVYHMMKLPDSYHALKITFSMVGMIGVYIFYRAFTLFLQQDKIFIFYILGFYPTILLWTSQIIKDPLVLLGVACYTYGVIGWYKLGKIRYFLWAGFGLWFASFMRMWYGPILLAPLIIFFLINNKISWMSKIVFLVIVVFTLLVLSNIFAEAFKIEDSKDILAETNKIAANFASQSNSGSKIDSFNSPIQMLAFIPIGMFAAFFRPLPGEILNLFALISGFENLFLLWFFVKSIKRIEIKYIIDPLILWAISFMIIWSAIYGIVAIGDLGSAVRYRVPVLPILVALLLYFQYSNKITQVKLNDSKVLKNKKLILKLKV